MENMEYDKESDTYTCRYGRQLAAVTTRKRRTVSGYLRETTIYACPDCSGCPHKTSCIKGNNCCTPVEQRNKQVEVAKKLMEKRARCMQRIIGEAGCMLRMNRSIQAEGSFSGIKDGMGFRRYLSRGKKNVLAESILIAMARNINKLHQKIQTGRTGTHLYELKSA